MFGFYNSNKLVLWKFFGNKAGGESLKNPHGQGGGSQNVHVCPQGGRGVKKTQKTVHMVCR